MAGAVDDFDKRLRRIRRNHRRMARGYVPFVGDDGLIVRRRRRTLRLPLRGVLLLAIGFFGFKGLVLAHLGQETYDTRVAALAAGTTVEQAGAWMMQADPVTTGIAVRVWPLLH